MGVVLMLAASPSGASSRTATGIRVTAGTQARITPTAVAGAAGYLWMLGTYPCATGSCPVLMRSSDGGKSWVQVGTPPPPVDTLAFANREDGYAYFPGDTTETSVLYWTKDAGKSWRLAPTDFQQSQDLSIIATRGLAYALGYQDCLPDRGCKSLDLSSSAVTSNVWTTRRVPVDTAKYTVGLAAFGSKVWLIVTLAGGSKAELFVSHDGGKSFASLPSTGMAGLGCHATATSGATLWGFCPTGMAGYAVRSTDGGRVFKYLPGTTSPNASNILPVSDDEAIFEDETSTHLRLTRDGGASFTSVLSGVYGGCAVAFASKTTWLVLGQFGQNHPMWRTTNGGRSWRPVKVPSV